MKSCVTPREKNTAIIFDVDGVLVENRNQETCISIDLLKEISEYFYLYLCTGNNKKRLLEVIPKKILSIIDGYALSNGNKFYINGKVISQEINILSEKDKKEINRIAKKIAEQTLWQLNIPQLEPRWWGWYNFSFLPRPHTQQERELFIWWNEAYNELWFSLKEFNMALQGKFQAFKGGWVSVDILPYGVNKSQIIPLLKEYNSEVKRIIFFGDNMDFGGNDEPLKKILKEENEKEGRNHHWHFIKKWPKHTERILKHLLYKIKKIT